MQIRKGYGHLLPRKAGGEEDDREPQLLKSGNRVLRTVIQ